MAFKNWVTVHCLHFLRRLKHGERCKEKVRGAFRAWAFRQGVNWSDVLINELQVTSYELRLLHELRLTIYFYCTSYESLFAYELRVPVYCTSYELFFTYELRVTFYIRVTSYCLFHELWVTIIAPVTSYCLLHELRVTFCIRVTSYCLLYESRVIL